MLALSVLCLGALFLSLFVLDAPLLAANGLPAAAGAMVQQQQSMMPAPHPHQQQPPPPPMNLPSPPKSSSTTTNLDDDDASKAMIPTSTLVQPLTTTNCGALTTVDVKHLGEYTGKALEHEFKHR